MESNAKLPEEVTHITPQTPQPKGQLARLSQLRIDTEVNPP